MKNYYFIPVVCILLLCGQHLQAQEFEYQKANIYLLKKDFTVTENANKAVYILQVIKYSDTNYTCRYYNKLGPMIKQEAFLDSNLSIPNGRFLWYDKNGDIDSSAYVYRGHKIERVFDTNSITLDLAGIEKQNEDQYKQSLKDDSKLQIPASFNGNNKKWMNYLSKNLLVTDRFCQSMTPGEYHITVSFLINKEGKVDEVELLHSIEWSQDLEVFDIFENSPLWQPAIQNGKNVIYRQKENLHFTVRNTYSAALDF